MGKKIAKNAKAGRRTCLRSYIVKLIKASASGEADTTTSAAAVELLNTMANHLLERSFEAAENVRDQVMASKTIDVRVIKACLPLVIPSEVLADAQDAGDRALVRIMKVA